MAWLWNSWEEYVAAVNPVAVQGSSDRVRLSHTDSRSLTKHSLYEAVRELKENALELKKLGFKGREISTPAHNPAIVSKAFVLVQDAVYAGEELLLYHKRLAQSRAAYGFLHQQLLINEWERYAKTHRITREINQLVSDMDKLLQDYDSLVEEDRELLVYGNELPDPLKDDFCLARDLFSVGFDEVGLMIAGRGEEGVLRKIADFRSGATISGPPKNFDLIEAMFRDGVISKDTKALLHYLRELRNSEAHSDGTKRRSLDNPRGTATTVAPHFQITSS